MHYIKDAVLKIKIYEALKQIALCVIFQEFEKIAISNKIPLS
jgi:hypothetical protein